jgi:hypothetical protein
MQRAATTTMPTTRDMIFTYSSCLGKSGRAAKAGEADNRITAPRHKSRDESLLIKSPVGRLGSNCFTSCLFKGIFDKTVLNPLLCNTAISQFALIWREFSVNVVIYIFNKM